MLMRQAITTKYLAPSNVRGARVKAIAFAGSVTLSWDHSLSIKGNHTKAAEALANKFEWVGSWYGGADMKSGYCFVCVDTRHDDGTPSFNVKG